MEDGGRFHIWYYTPGLGFITEEAKGPRVEPEIAILLNGHAVKFPSKYLCLYL